MVAPINIAGERYGRLVAIKRAPNIGRRTIWQFKCDCGKIIDQSLERVRCGVTRSCGCLRKETTAKRSITHGHARDYQHSPELRAWSHAKGRCFNPTDAKFRIYGGRGITMCPQWTADFAVFIQDMGQRPSGTTLDRIDPNGNYEPGNCRWATALEQARTRRNNVMVNYDGRTMILKDFAIAVGIDYKKLWATIKRTGLSPVEAAAQM